MWYLFYHLNSSKRHIADFIVEILLECGHFEFEMFTDKNCSILGTIVSKTVYRGSSEVASGGVL